MYKKQKESVKNASHNLTFLKFLLLDKCAGFTKNPHHVINNLS